MGLELMFDFIGIVFLDFCRPGIVFGRRGSSSDKLVCCTPRKGTDLERIVTDWIQLSLAGRSTPRARTGPMLRPLSAFSSALSASAPCAQQPVEDLLEWRTDRVPLCADRFRQDR